MAVGSDLLEASYDHETVGSGTIRFKSGEETTVNLGGNRTEDDSQGLAADGTTIRRITNSRWKVEGTPAWDKSSSTLEDLVSMAGSPIEGDWSFTFVDGTVYQGKGSPVGELNGQGGAATHEFIASGGGKLKKVG